MIFPGVRKYPKTIQIKDDIWGIKFCRKIPERHYGLEVIDGLCDPSDLMIYIRLRQGREETFSTFLHEVLHAIEFSWDFEIDETDAHPKVYRLEQAIALLMKINF